MMYQRNYGEVSRTPVSSRTSSDVAITKEVHQAIRAEFVKGLKKLAIDPDLHLGSSTTSATSEISTCPYSLIDMVTSSAVSPCQLHRHSKFPCIHS